MRKVIVVTQKNWEKLTKLKLKHKFKSLDEVIHSLLRNGVEGNGRRKPN